MVDFEKLKCIAQAAFSQAITGIAAIDAELEFHRTFGPSGVLDLISEAQRMERAMKRQASAALAGMDAARRSSGIQLQLAEQARAESSPDALASERAANAKLTEENERLLAVLAIPVFTAGYSPYLNALAGMEGANHDVAHDVFANGDKPLTVYYGEKRVFTTLAEFMEAHPKPAAPATRSCSKCGAKALPVGAYCKGIDCPLNPSQAKE